MVLIVLELKTRMKKGEKRDMKKKFPIYSDTATH